MRRRKPLRAFSALVAGILSWRVVGSQQPAPPQKPPQLEERVVVQLVQLPCIATDRQGRPVTDLKKEEIRVKLRGQEPRIAYLEALAGDTNQASEPVPDVRVYLDAAGTKEACKPNDLVKPGTPVNELQRSGAMSQVVILDANWRWTSEERCQSVQSGPVWVQSDSITKDYPSKN